MLPEFLALQSDNADDSRHSWTWTLHEHYSIQHVPTKGFSGASQERKDHDNKLHDVSRRRSSLSSRALWSRDADF